MGDAAEVGARIALIRKHRQLTQHGLATLASVSYSLLTKVESGSRPASEGFIAACARALGVEIPVLLGESAPEVTQDQRLGKMLGRVRTQLDLYDLDPDETITPRPLPVLRDAVRVANVVGQAARYESMTPVLPGLYAELHAAANTWTGTDRADAWGLLAEAYRCAHTVGIAAGFPDLSLTALNRMDWAAQQAGDRAPALRAAREYLRITAYLRRHDYETGWHLNNAGRSHLEGTDAKTPGALIASGQLNLGAAVISARTGDASGARDYLNEAERYADQTGEDLETFWFGFGPTNVAVHRVITMIELGDYSHAIHLGEFIQFPRGWLPTRIGHHHFDLARAYQRMNLPEQSLRHLQIARQVAPGQARRHPLVRGVVVDLLQTARQPSEALTRYAAWIGV